MYSYTLPLLGHVSIDLEYNAHTGEVYSAQTYNGAEMIYWLPDKFDNLHSYLMSYPVWILHYSPTDLIKLLKSPIPSFITIYDTMSLIRYLDENEPRGLKYLSEKYLDKKVFSLKNSDLPGTTDENEFSQYVIDLVSPCTLEYRDLVNYVNQWKRKAKIKTRPADYSTIPLPLAKYYALHDVHSTYHLFFKICQMLDEDTLSTYKEVECPVNRVMLNASIKGIKQDTHAMSGIIVDLENHLLDIANELEQAGVDINTASNKQLGERLLELGIDVQESEHGNYVLDRQELESMDNHISRLLLKQRHYSKLLSTYAKVVPEVHPLFDTVGAKSSRMSSRYPNFQQLPRETEIDIRSTYHPLDGYVFVSADYASMESVVTADLTKDATLIKSVSDGLDVHTLLARSIYKDANPELNDEDWLKIHKGTLRQKTKTDVYALMYGGTWRTLINNGHTEELAKHIEKEYRAMYSTLFQWRRKMTKQFLKDGKIRYFNAAFYRHIPTGFDFMSASYNNMINSVLNSLVQGACAFITKKAILDIDKEIKNRKLDAWVSLAIHDEIVVQCKPEDAELVCKIVEDSMRVKVIDMYLSADAEIKHTLSKK